MLRGAEAPVNGMEGVRRWGNSWQSRWKAIGSVTTSDFRDFPKNHDQLKASTSEGTFAEMLEDSKLARIGDPIGKKVEGEIIAATGSHLYVDFGHKFHAVVPIPEGSPEGWVKGRRVIVVVRDLELATHFLGDSKDTSLLEAEAELVSVT